MIDEQRSAALRDERNKIVNKAKRFSWIEFTSPRVGINPRVIQFKVYIEIKPEELDTNQFKRWVANLFDGFTIQMLHKSCEAICDELYENIASQYPNRDIQINAHENACEGVTIFYNTI